MTAREFERAYATRSQVTVRWLRRYRTVRPCDCGAPECEGWQSIGYRFAREEGPRYRWSRWWLLADLWRRASALL